MLEVKCKNFLLFFLAVVYGFMNTLFFMKKDAFMEEGS